MSSVADDTSGSGTASTDEGTAGKKTRRRPRVSARKVAHGAKVGTDAVRSRIASLIWIVAVVCAVVLALGALVVALGAEPDNQVVQWLTGGADVLAGPAGDTKDGIFQFQKKNGQADQVKNALVNWGIAAAAYLIVGRVLDRIIRP